jgi:recombination protein U
MVLPNNMGMYAEEIVNRTCDYCLNNNVNLYIEKRHLPIKITRKINENTILGKLLSKSTVDYFGSYKNIFFQFETKQTNNTYFSLSLFKEHQLKALEKFSKNNSVIFAIVYFEKNEKFYILNAS